MKKIFKLIITIIILVVGLGLIGWALLVLSRNEDDSELSSSENKWLEDNKEEMIDISIPTGIPIFSGEGDGVFFDFLDYFEKETDLEFNKISYGVSDDVSSSYSFQIVNESDSEDLLFSKDTYVILRKTKGKFNSITDIKGFNVGVLNKDKTLLSYYLGDLEYKYYDDEESLMNSFKEDMVNVIILPHNEYLDTILSNNYYVAYYISEINSEYVLSLDGEEEKLNSIFTKVYNRWTELEESYNKHLFNIYTTNKDIDEIKESEFKSIRYVYGYVPLLPYEEHNEKSFIGINSSYINSFMDLTGIEFEFKEYSSIDKLRTAFASDKVDIMFSYYSLEDIKNVSKIYPHVDSDYVLITSLENEVIINTLKGLKDKEVYTIKNTYVSDYIKTYNDATVVELNDVDALLVKLDNSSIAAIDRDVYNYYKTRGLEEFTVIYENDLSYDYQFVIKNNDENKTFISLFDSYVWNSDLKRLNYLGLSDIEILGVKRNTLLDYLGYLIVGFVLFVILLKVVSTLMINNKRSNVIKKDEKMKFVDLLTSLKNRNYLNHNIEKWDETTIYPQTIILVDLNNIKYINDNHGYDEGDKLIKAAANILINNQLEKSDIMRTDGNEFLIYLVGYKEREIATYIRKLYKDLKTLDYGYGAALGYSMIEDEIKTLEDAINEATLDMRTNKELSE